MKTCKNFFWGKVEAVMNEERSDEVNRLLLLVALEALWNEEQSVTHRSRRSLLHAF